MLKIKIDRELCSGAGNCVALAPTVFKLDKTNKAVILDPDSIDDEALMEAAESCPENAIILENANGDQVYP
jgi:ferredoxin